MDKEQNTQNTSRENVPAPSASETNADVVSTPKTGDVENTAATPDSETNADVVSTPKTSDVENTAATPDTDETAVNTAGEDSNEPSKQQSGDCYTAVVDGQQDLTQGSSPQQSLPPIIQIPSPENQNGGKANASQSGAPTKSKSKTSAGTKLFIAFVAVMLTITVLLFSTSTVLVALLVAKGQIDPSYGTSPDESRSEIYSPDKSSPDQEQTDPPRVSETPPPSNYESDSWYNPDDLNNDALSAYEKVCALCNPSVVAISTDVGSGSGVIWTSDGYIVTNNHVVDGASSLSVMLSNGKKYPASLIGTDVENDLALVRINVSGLLATRLGDSDSLRMGQPVVAIGNALGILSNTATEGILSSITREITVEGQTMNLMQISAPINPGNSGGGCFDINGNLIGIVNAKTSAAGIEGLGYAIPVNTAKAVIGQMIENDETTLQKGIGITGCYEITEKNYAEFSSESLLKQIEKINGSPLYGIYIISDGLVEYVNGSGDTFENGDVLKSINGQQVTTLEDISSIVSNCAVGEELTITVIRLTQTGGFMRPTYNLEEHTFKIRVIEMYK